IFRGGRPAIVGESDPPRSLMEHARDIGADLRLCGRDFQFDRTGQGRWRWRSGEIELALPRPHLAAPCQFANASAAIAALHALRERLDWNPRAIMQGVSSARVAARLQTFSATTDIPELIVDVAHNPQAARVLGQWLRSRPIPGRTLAVFGALGDKDVQGVVNALAGDFDAWFLAGLDRDSPRGLDAAALGALVGVAAAVESIALSTHADVAEALAAACNRAQVGDRILAFGSFFVAAAALDFAQHHGLSGA
ncbi:MAG: cyanophycin synthetase, partial [Dokdonella sp.]